MLCSFQGNQALKNFRAQFAIFQQESQGQYFSKDDEHSLCLSDKEYIRILLLPLHLYQIQHLYKPDWIWRQCYYSVAWFSQSQAFCKKYRIRKNTLKEHAHPSSLTSFHHNTSQLLAIPELLHFPSKYHSPLSTSHLSFNSLSHFMLFNQFSSSCMQPPYPPPRLHFTGLNKTNSSHLLEVRLSFPGH